MGFIDEISYIEVNRMSIKAFQNVSKSSKIKCIIVIMHNILIDALNARVVFDARD